MRLYTLGCRLVIFAVINFQSITRHRTLCCPNQHCIREWSVPLVSLWYAYVFPYLHVPLGSPLNSNAQELVPCTITIYLTHFNLTEIVRPPNCGDSQIWLLVRLGLVFLIFCEDEYIFWEHVHYAGDQGWQFRPYFSFFAPHYCYFPMRVRESILGCHASQCTDSHL